jgi:hypothetical protein
MGVDATSTFIECNDSANATRELQIRQGTNGNVIVIDTDGDVGIGMSTPSTKLEVDGYQTFYDSTKLPGQNTTGSDLVPSKIILGNEYAPQIRTFYPNGGYSDAVDLEFWTAGQNIATDNTSSRVTIKAQSGNVGIGTTTPYAKLHVNGTGDSSTALQTGNRRYFGYDTGFVTGTSSNGDPADTISIYGTGRIVSGTYIVSHSNTTFSDRRIKDNIVDVQDDTCLQKLRLIKPKQYTYQDTFAKGTAPVWGFIAQEVAETLEYAVEKMEKAIPNVYKLASVSEDGTVLTFEESILLETMDTIKVQLKTLVSEEHDVIVSEVLSSTSVRLTEPLSEEHHTGTIGEESIVRKVFVYGQWVDDFHVLKKDAIFTVAVSALQEVDRQQQLHKNKISTLEARVALLEQRLNNAGL